MRKELSEMTLEELWQLFPIILTPHKPYWKAWYTQEEEQLSSFLQPAAKIYHIGSTSVSDIWAKPTIDILVEADRNDFISIKDQLICHGYVCMAQNDQRIDFNKGYTPDGFAEKVFHLHLREYGDHDELYFRDYLNDHYDIAKQYEQLKLSLWKKYEHDRDGYTDRKTEFIQKYTQIAKEEFGERYD
jgi:GrpB-like predicted nucleotidyltransferase (UPF0157 family)